MAAMPPPAWDPDSELAGFVARTLRFPSDYDGEVTATLVRQERLVGTPKGAVLYLHGFIDYFFQAHVAHAFNAHGYNFYALDMRKYGRSLPAAHPNFCKDFHEYFAEISAALDIIVEEGHADAILLAHSTGALAAVLYAEGGGHRQRVSRIILNSPFLEFKEPRWMTRLAAALGRLFPFLPKGDPVCRWYGRSLHPSAGLGGEWPFNLRLKPLDGFAAYFGWIRAVVQVQDRIAAGLGLTLPILVLHSDRSLDCDGWREEFHRADMVLNVADMVRLSPKLGSAVTVRAIAGGKHDLTLSRPDVRPRVLDVMLDWLR